MVPAKTVAASTSISGCSFVPKQFNPGLQGYKRTIFDPQKALKFCISTIQDYVNVKAQNDIAITKLTCHV